MFSATVLRYLESLCTKNSEIKACPPVIYSFISEIQKTVFGTLFQEPLEGFTMRISEFLTQGVNSFDGLGRLLHGGYAEVDIDFFG